MMMLMRIHASEQPICSQHANPAMQTLAEALFLLLYGQCIFCTKIGIDRKSVV